jgi:soluble lytic murein transglycosylase-like protein
MMMRSTRCVSSNRCSYHWSSIFPSRPELTTVTLSRRTQRHSYADALDRASKRLCSLSPIARILAAVTLFLFPSAAFFRFASPASAQNLSRAESTDRLAKIIEEASDRFAVPARWIRAVIQIESGGDEHGISPRGAMGLMQLMPGTWVELSVRYGLGFDPFDPRDNIFAGTAYLREMHDRFGTVGFLAAYHAGPSRYEQHLATGQPLPPDTVAYVAAVAPLLGDEHGDRTAFGGKRAIPWRQSPLFIGRVDARD